MASLEKLSAIHQNHPLNDEIWGIFAESGYTKYIFASVREYEESEKITNPLAVLEARKTLSQSCFDYMKSDEDVIAVMDAFDYAYYHHDNPKRPGKQRRGTGEHYMTHLSSVAQILADMGCDRQTIQAALLHDTIEDTEVDNTDISVLFGRDVLKAIETVTKVTGPDAMVLEDRTIAQVFESLLDQDEARGILIKLADRIHNMRTIKGISSERKRKEIALQTLQFYVPLARLVNLPGIADELEYLSTLEIWPETQDLQTRVLQAESEFDNLSHQKKLTRLFNGILSSEMSQFKDKFKYFHIEKPHRMEYLVFDTNENGMTNPSFRQPKDLSVEVVFENEEDFEGICENLCQIWGKSLEDFIEEDGVAIIPWTFGIGENAYKYNIRFYRNEESFERQKASLATVYMHPKIRTEIFTKQIEAVDSLLSKPRAMLARIRGGRAKGLVDEFTQGMNRSFIFAITPKNERIVLPAGSTGWEFALSISPELTLHARYILVNGEQKPLTYLIKDGDSVQVLPDYYQRKGVLPWSVDISALKSISDESNREFIKKKLRDVIETGLELNLPRIREILEKIGSAKIEDINDYLNTYIDQSGITPKELRNIRNLLNRIKRKGYTDVSEYGAYAEKVYAQAENEGENLLTGSYHEKYHDLPRADFLNVWDILAVKDHYFQKFNDRVRFTRTKEQAFSDFLIDCGLGRVDEEKIELFLQTYHEFQKSMPVVEYSGVDRSRLLIALNAILNIGAGNILTTDQLNNIPGFPVGWVKVVFGYKEIFPGTQAAVANLFAMIARVLENNLLEETIIERTIEVKYPPNTAIAPLVGILEVLGFAIIHLDNKKGMISIQTTKLETPENYQEMMAILDSVSILIKRLSNQQ
jgi:GTP pyrophosphokinase